MTSHVIRLSPVSLYITRIRASFEVFSRLCCNCCCSSSSPSSSYPSTYRRAPGSLPLMCASSRSQAQGHDSLTCGRGRGETRLYGHGMSYRAKSCPVVPSRSAKPTRPAVTPTRRQSRGTSNPVRVCDGPIYARALLYHRVRYQLCDVDRGRLTTSTSNKTAEQVAVGLIYYHHHHHYYFNISVCFVVTSIHRSTTRSPAAALPM